MHIGILGTGAVATTLGSGLAAAGHTITLGSRDPGAAGESPFPVAARLDTVRAADVVVNATPGAASVEVVEGIGAAEFAGKVVLDLANATTPGFDLVYPNSSVGEALQRALPEAKVVKTLNTIGAPLMVTPAAIGPSTVFVSGDDADAKATVAGLLRDLGRNDDSILDLGPIASARGPEHYFLLFVGLWQATGTPALNVRLVQAAGVPA